MSSSCIYVAPSVLGEITHERGTSMILPSESQALQGRKKNFFLLIAQVKNTHLNKNKSICNGECLYK